MRITLSQLYACIFLLCLGLQVMTPGSLAHAAQPWHAVSGHGILNACSVLTIDDVRGVFGGRVVKSHSGRQGGFDACDYLVGKGFVIFLESTSSLLKSRHNRLQSAAQMYAEARKGIPRGAQPVRGLGDKAFWAGGVRQLWVLKGDVVFAVSQFMTDRNVLPSLRRVAHKVLLHL